MAKIKHTKNELKAQREALARYERFLPMLQLKKQQLQAEIQTMAARIADQQADEARVRADTDAWAALWAEPVELDTFLSVDAVEVDTGNIAGVKIPILRRVVFNRAAYDLFATPPWVDDAVDALEKLVRLRIERETLEEQRRLIAEELRITSQRVNLFEKVKIPECRENIRIIRIFLGDEQTAAVARGKMAKKRTERVAYQDAAA